jgi:hypothetical protein
MFYLNLQGILRVLLLQPGQHTVATVEEFPTPQAGWLLNLPMRKRRGFRTPDHSGSRGPFRPRAGSGIAPTPEAPVQHLPTTLPPPHREVMLGKEGVDRDDHLHTHNQAALTALALVTVWRGNTSVAADIARMAAD